MDINQRKELLSRAYVSAIAAQVGFRSAIPDVDDDSIDLLLRGRGFSSSVRNPQLDVQLKCTSKNSGCSEFLSFQLPLKNYDDLRGEDVLCPRYLFILVVPNDAAEWLSHDVDHMKLSHCCYWTSLRGFEASTNETSVTIRVPRKNVLTASSLHSLMEMARQKRVAA